MLGSILFFLSDNRRRKNPILSEGVLIAECKTVSLKCENQSSAFTSAEFRKTVLSCIFLSLSMYRIQSFSSQGFAFALDFM